MVSRASSVGIVPLKRLPWSSLHAEQMMGRLTCGQSSCALCSIGTGQKKSSNWLVKGGHIQRFRQHGEPRKLDRDSAAQAIVLETPACRKKDSGSGVGG